MNKRIVYMIKDILCYNLFEKYKTNNIQQNYKIPDLLIKVPFLSSGVEHVKLENIINSKKLNNTLPDFIKRRKPCIIYTYKQPIRNKIFNYDETLEKYLKYKI